MAIITTDEVKVFLQITGTTKDDLIEALIPLVEADIEKECNQLPDDVGIKIPASLMIGYLINKTRDQSSGIGLSSESQGGYSYVNTSEFGNNTGYPASITGMLKKYRLVKPHFGTVLQQHWDRRGLAPDALAKNQVTDGIDGVKLDANQEE